MIKFVDEKGNEFFECNKAEARKVKNKILYEREWSDFSLIAGVNYFHYHINETKRDVKETFNVKQEQTPIDTLIKCVETLKTINTSLFPRFFLTNNNFRNKIVKNRKSICSRNKLFHLFFNSIELNENKSTNDKKLFNFGVYAKIAHGLYIIENKTLNDKEIILLCDGELKNGLIISFDSYKVILS